VFITVILNFLNILYFFALNPLPLLNTSTQSGKTLPKKWQNFTQKVAKLYLKSGSKTWEAY